MRSLTEHTQLRRCSDVVVLVGRRAAVAARVVVSDAPDDQIAASQQRVLLIPAGRQRGGAHECFVRENVLEFQRIST